MTDVNASLREILNTQGQGFNAMLAGIQSGIGRIDASLQYARQKRDQKALIDYQMDKQIEKYKETVAIQKEADRELRQEQNNIRVLEQINKNAEIQQKVQKEINDQIVTANKTLREFAKPLIDIGFDLKYLPSAIFEIEGDQYKIKFAGMTPDDETKTYGTIQDFMQDVEPIMKFAGIAEQFNIDELDRTTTSDGRTTYVGISDFQSDKNRIASRSAGWKELAQEYITGKRVPNKRQPGNEADSQRKEVQQMIAATERFKTIYSTNIKNAIAINNITLPAIDTTIEAVTKKYATAESGKPEKAEYADHLAFLYKYKAAFSDQLAEFEQQGKVFSLPQLQFSKGKIIFTDGKTDPQAKADSQALGG